MEPADDSLRALVTTLAPRAAALAVARQLVDDERVVCAPVGDDLAVRRALVGEEAT